ncbi:MAG: Ig-like domain-containing protein, partial [Actinomycetota bacterium]|nr:Ig-like domain-containing protein [Actinomycetota bacterium]
CTSPKTYNNLSDGTYTFEVRAKDVAGNTDGSPDSRTFTVDTQAPSAPVINSPAQGSYNNTGNVALSGTAEANSTVELFEGTTSKGKTTAGASGNWSKTLTGVADGSHTYTAKATDAVGNTSAVSNARTVIVDTKAPSAPVITGPANSYDNDGNFTVSGTAEANSTVELFEGRTSKGKATVNGYGAWSVALRNVASGSHSYTAKATDSAGNTSAASSARTIIVDKTAPVVTGIGTTTVSRKTTFRATFSEAMNPASLNTTTFTLVKQGTNTPVAATVRYNAASKTVTLSPKSNLLPGTYTVTVKGGASGAKDLAGNALAANKVWSYKAR